jgi:hypothetical protein
MKRKSLLLSSFAYFSTITAAVLICSEAITASAGEQQTFTADQMKVRLWRGGSMVDAPNASGPKVARVGRDWSIEWSMEPQKPHTLDYTRLYDVYVRCLGDFTLGMYGVNRSGFVMGNRPISLSKWKNIRIVREKLHPRDYLTTNGVGKAGYVGAVSFVPHPESEEEAAVRTRKLPGFHLDAEEEASISLKGICRQPVTILTGMAKDGFCPNPVLQLEARLKSGKVKVYPIRTGIAELTVAPEVPDDPIVELKFSTPGKGNRTIAEVAFATPESPDFRIVDWQISCRELNSFDIIKVNRELGAFRELSNYNIKREKLFAARPQAPFLLFRESTMRKVFEYGIPAVWRTAAPGKSIDVSIAGREAEHLQLVLIPRNNDRQSLRISWKPQFEMPLSVTFETVEYIQSARRAYPQLNEETASYPDPLLPVSGDRVLLNGRNLPLWVSIEAPAGIKAGLYPGILEISSEDGSYSQSIALNIKVRNFSLPQRSRFRTCFFLNRPFVLDYFGIKNWQEEKAMYRKLIELSAGNRLTLMPMNEHRPTSVRPLWTARQDETGKYRFDFTKENEITRMILDEFHGNGYNVSPSPTWDRYFGYMWLTDPATGGDKRLPYSMQAPEFEKIYRDFLEAAWKNAKENGWENYAYHYIWDESSGEEWNRLHLMSKKFAPELKNLAVGYNLAKMPEEVRDAVDIWCPLSASLDQKFAAERVAKGGESWAYVCVIPKNRYNLFVDHEAFTHRALLWWCQTRQVTGLLYWGVCFWDRAVTTMKKTGKTWPEIEWHANQFPDGNGDGYLIYPDAATGGLYRSLRLAVLRDGLEDMEYFMILSRLKEEAAKSGSASMRRWLAEANKAEAGIRQVIAGENRDSGKGVAGDYNGEMLENVRKRIGDLIEEYIRKVPGTDVEK